MTISATGSCLCGRVRYETHDKLRSVVACHCSQCRKTSGHYVAATQVAKEKLTIFGAENLTWFGSSETAKRGFCSVCGSQMFWDLLDRGRVSVMAGTLDDPTGLTMDRQIFAGCKADYYSLPDAQIVDPETL